MNPLFIIADAGVNDNGDVDRALRILDASADAGADCRKIRFPAGDLAGIRAGVKHLTLERTPLGPDHRASHGDVAGMVAEAGSAETALGDGVDFPPPGELDNVRLAAESRVAPHASGADAFSTADNVTANRPGSAACRSTIGRAGPT